MKYIVEVEAPVPSNLDEIAGKVAASFNISDAKAMALLRRAPGAMTKAVSEREAEVVAGIFERAGLLVVKRQVAEDGEVPPQPQAREGGAAEPAAGAAGSSAMDAAAEEAPAMDADAMDGAAMDAAPGGAVDAPASPEAAGGGERSGEPDVWSQPVDAGAPSGGGNEAVEDFSRRDDFEQQADVGWDSGWGAGAAEDGPAGAGGGRVAGGAGLADRDAVDAAGDGGAAAAVDAGAVGADAVDVDFGTPPREREAPYPESEADGAGWPAGDAGVADAGVADAEVADGAVADGAGGAVAMEGAEAEPAAPRRRGRRQRPAQAADVAAWRPAGARAAERGVDDTRLRRGGVRRGIAWVGVLPPLLSLLAMGAVMLATLVPYARDQRAAQAASAAASQAATLDALTGGLPLNAQTLQSALADLSRQSQALLRPQGVQLMVITDASGVPLAGWYQAARTPVAMPPATRQAVSARAQGAVAGQPASPPATFGQRLRDSWHSVRAMVGLGSEATVLRATPVTSGGQGIGAVVVGVPPVSGDSALGSGVELVLLFGLIPLLIGILMALGLTGGLRRKVQYLLEAADRISRGDLDEPVSLASRDELGQLARAIERMRVSLAALLEHRRRNR